MKIVLTTAVVATSQLALVGLAVAPQLSARIVGDTYLVRVAPVDPIDPFRGAYVALDYPDLRHDGSQSRLAGRRGVRRRLHHAGRGGRRLDR